jgi:hypothetical protein
MEGEVGDRRAHLGTALATLNELNRIVTARVIVMVSSTSPHTFNWLMHRN